MTASSSVLSSSEESVKKKEESKKEEEKIQIKKILVPIDGSSYSIKAAKYAIEVAKLQRAQILCIHIIAKLPYGYGFAGSSIEQYFEDIKNQSLSWFNQIIKMGHDSDIKDIKTHILINASSVADAIINYAKDNSMDLIVIGTKGRTGLERFVIGSVANGVTMHAHCPVFLVR
jgi:nucleotide-binding universal stress UspA family protein